MPPLVMGAGLGDVDVEGAGPGGQLAEEGVAHHAVGIGKGVPVAEAFQRSGLAVRRGQVMAVVWSPRSPGGPGPPPTLARHTTHLSSG
jgi:hypothetical protein